MTAPLTGDRGHTAEGRALRRDTVLVAVGQVAAVVSALLLAVVGARVLSTAEFGALSWALSWLAFLAVLAQFGLTQVATIAVARQERGAHAPLVRRLVVAQAVGVVATAALWHWALGPAVAAAGAPASAYRPLVLLVALWLPAAALGPVLVNVLRARDRFGLALVFGEHVRRVVLVGVLLAGAVVAAGGSSAGGSSAQGSSARGAAAWTVAIETVVVLAALLLLARDVGPVRRGRHAAGRVAADGPGTGGPAGVPDGAGSPWGLLRWGRAFAVATLASAALPQAGVWLLALVAPVEEVAVFAVAVRIAVLAAVPAAIGMRTLAPRVAAAAGAGRLPALQEPVRRFAVWSTAATASVVVLLAAAGPALLPALFGAEYGAALVPALVMSAGVLVNAWTGPCSVVLSHAGHQRSVAVSALACALAFAGLATWWGSVWGGTGVAAAAAVAMGTRNLQLAWLAHRTLGIRTIAAPARR